MGWYFSRPFSSLGTSARSTITPAVGVGDDYAWHCAPEACSLLSMLKTKGGGGDAREWWAVVPGLSNDGAKIGATLWSALLKNERREG